MKHRLHVQKKASSTSKLTPAHRFQSRPFTPPTEASPQQQMPDLQTQRENAERLGYNFANIPIFAPNSSPPPIQPKLTIGQPGDKYEQEADAVARQVVTQINAPETVQREELPEEEEELQMKSDSGTIQREEMPEEKEELQMKPMVQLQPEGGMAATPDLEASIQQAKGGGQPLAESVREPMEQAFGADFSGVRVHTDAKSDALNQSIQAKAFTTGQDVFFRQGAYEPSSRGGQELIAHELTHTLQQKGHNLSCCIVQRAIGYEFEVPGSSTRRAIPPLVKKEKAGTWQLPNPNANTVNRIYSGRFGRQKNVGRLLPLQKAIKILQGEHFTLEADDSNNGTNMEFVTSLPPFPETASGRAELIHTMHQIRKVAAYIISQHPRPVTGIDLENQGFGTAMMPHSVVTLMTNQITGNPQTTAAIRLDQIARLMTEIGAAQPGETAQQQQARSEGRDDLQGQSGGADRALVGSAAANARNAIANYTHDSQNNPLPGGIGSESLIGLLALIISYLRKADGGAQAYAKGIAPLMARTNFATMFRSLRRREQRFFAANNAREWIHLVLSTANLSTAMNGGTPLFRSGLVYLPSIANMTPQQINQYRYRLNALTKDLWLLEMTRGVDVLSTQGWLQYGGSPNLSQEFESMGALGNRKENVANNTVPAPIFELRRMDKDVDYTQWTAIAVGVFDYLWAVNKQRQATYARNRVW